MRVRGIDVSSYQGKIDWERVKPYIDFAIIRCGYGNNLKSQDDIYFERNAEYCKKLNIPFGVYLYSYATNLDEARSEVEHTLRLIKDKKLEYPVYLDVENRRQMALRQEELTDIVDYYASEMEKAGYYVGIYASVDRFRGILSSARLNYDKWVAEWGDKLTYDNEKVGLWQHTAYEEMPGIRTRVDGDYALKDYPKIIRDLGLNHLEEKRKYKVGDIVYISGEIYTDYNAEKIKDRVCDRKVEITKVDENDVKAPYQIDHSEEWIKEEDIFIKCDR